MALPLVIAGLAVAKGAMSAYEKEKQRKADKRQLQGQLSALTDLAKVTPAERDYVKRRRRIAAEGDPMINEEFRKKTGAIRQEGAFARQRAQGQAIQQGLEGSIVAQELRRKVDKDVLTSVADQARQMALANAQAKRRAEGEIEQMNLRTDARKADIDYKKAGVRGQIDALGGYDRWGTLANVALGGAEAYVGAKSPAPTTASTGTTGSSGGSDYSDWEVV